MAKKIENEIDTNKEKSPLEIITISISEDPLNPGLPVEVGYNGKFYPIEREKETKVPRQVFNILKEAHYPVSRVD